MLGELTSYKVVVWRFGILILIKSSFFEHGMPYFPQLRNITSVKYTRPSDYVTHLSIW